MGQKYTISSVQCLQRSGFQLRNLQTPRSNLISGVFVRRASTIPSSTPDDPFYHSEWPRHKNPSPYDVLNIEQSKFDRNTLRKRYYQIAKIYHPDISKNKNLVNHKGDALTDVHKNERFKLLTNAYTLLKDQDKKNLYDQFKMGWETNEQIITRTSSNSATRTAGAYSNHYSSYAYWNAGSWEDYQNLRDMNDPALKSEKMKVLAALAGLIIFSATIQGWLILNNVEKSILESRKIHGDTESDLGMVYMNYGYDQSRIARFRRFLWFRTFGLYREKDSLDESHRENEKILKEIFGEEYEKERSS